jgi:hypothetical protein
LALFLVDLQQAPHSPPKRRPRRRKHPVKTTRVRKDVLSRALAIADGDASKLAIKSTTKVVVDA